MLKNIIDEGQKFDFGKTSKFYAKHRDIYPEELFDRLHKIGIGTEGSQWLDLGTGTGVVPRGMAKYGADIIATDISENCIRRTGDWLSESGSGCNEGLSITGGFGMDQYPCY